MGIVLRVIALIGICISLLAAGIFIPKTFVEQIALLGMAIFIVVCYMCLYRAAVKKGVVP